MCSGHSSVISPHMVQAATYFLAGDLWTREPAGLHERKISSRILTGILSKYDTRSHLTAQASHLHFIHLSASALHSSPLKRSPDKGITGEVSTKISSLGTHFVALAATEAGVGVSEQVLHGVADVGVTVDIRDCSSDISFGHGDIITRTGGEGERRRGGERQNPAEGLGFGDGGTNYSTVQTAPAAESEVEREGRAMASGLPETEPKRRVSAASLVSWPSMD